MLASQAAGGRPPSPTRTRAPAPPVGGRSSRTAPGRRGEHDRPARADAETALEVGLLLDQFDLLERQIEAADRRVASLLDGETARLLLTIPGVGPATAATLIAEIGDIARFSDFDQLLAYAGVHPAERSSGRKGANPETSRHMSKAGNSHLRAAAYRIAVVGIQHNPVIAAHYARKRAAGKTPMNALGHCMPGTPPPPLQTPGPRGCQRTPRSGMPRPAHSGEADAMLPTDGSTETAVSPLPGVGEHPGSATTRAKPRRVHGSSPRPPVRRSGRRHLVGNSTDSTTGDAASTTRSKRASGAMIAMARIRMDDPSGTSNR